MQIIKTKTYLKNYKKKIIDKHMYDEKIRISNIESLIIESNNLHDLLISPFKCVYYIEKKKGNLKEYYTARINNKLRLLMKPIGNYPYNEMEIVEIEFVNVDDKHYEEG